VICTSTRLVLALTLAFASVSPALLQAQEEDDAVLKLAEPDFTLMGLPTSLRLPVRESAFRVTHRFARPLGEGDFGDLVDDLFGLDNGAVIGLEFRYGLVPGGQIGIHRSSLDKTIEIFGQYGLARQTDTMPLEIAAVASIEGINNLRDEHSPAFGVILTRLLGDRGALHVEPMIVASTNIIEGGDDDGTFMVGLGGRLRLTPTVYVVGEFVPRVSGFKPGVNHGSFAIEKRAGGHLFQLNFSNSFATTSGQLARGGFSNDDWHLGFNISRKFF
jgi:hypothetical protein